jgi:two-component system response regulator NreC
VAGGGVFLYPSAAKLVVEDYQARLGTDPVDALGQLSEREREVIKLIALGYTSSEAAEVLALSPKSVETYRTRIMQKLGVHSRIGLVQYALLHGLLKEI